MSLRTRSPSAVVQVITCLSACGPSLGRPAHLTSGSVESAELRHEHAGLERRLDAARELVEALSRAEDVTTRRRRMERLVVFFTAQLGDHARWDRRMQIESVPHDPPPSR